MSSTIHRLLQAVLLLAALCLVQVHSEKQLRGAVARQAQSCVLCRMSMFDTMDGSGRSGDETPLCIPIIDDVERDTEYDIKLPIDILHKYEEDIERGQLLLRLCDAVFSDDSLTIGPSPSYTVVTDSSHRHLLTKHLEIKSRMSVALISIRTSDSTPKYSAQEMALQMFGTGINLQTQYDACSFGKQSFYLSQHRINEYVAAPIASFARATDLVNAAQKQIRERMKISSVAQLADKIMVCVPPGTGNWAASAGVGHWRVNMNSNWCVSLSGSIHELGHTVGLLHSNEPGKAYEDRSGYMGSGYTNPVWPQKCFNGYHSWKFGWYADRHQVVSPDVNGQLIKLAAFVDYDKTSVDEKVIINISDRLFLLFNVAKGFNVDTEKKKNLVTVTEPTAKGTDSIAGLGSGQLFKVSNFNNSGKSLYIQACNTMRGQSGADIMVISLGLNKSVCGTSLPAPPSPPAPKPAPPAPKPAPPTPTPTPPVPKPSPPVRPITPLPNPSPPFGVSCSAKDFQRQCTTTAFCKKKYPSATDCHNGGGGVCMCGNEVCGCLSQPAPVPPPTPKPVVPPPSPKPVKVDFMTWLNDLLQRLLLQRRQNAGN